MNEVNPLSFVGWGIIKRLTNSNIFKRVYDFIIFVIQDDNILMNYLVVSVKMGMQIANEERSVFMVLLRLISLYMITIAVLAIVANFFPFLAWPIYILAIVGLIFCLGNIIYHLVLKKRRNLHR